MYQIEVVPQQGKFGSGKNTRRFRKIEGLFEFRAIDRQGIPEIQFPDGQRILGNHPDINRMLSEILGQSVTLSLEEQISHLDAGPIHLITTAALRWLQQKCPMATIDARRFRPNLLLDVPGTHKVEQDWIGKKLYIGNQVQLQVTALTERCAMVGFAQDDLPDDGWVLKAIDRDMTRRFGRHFGVYAKVMVPGMILKGTW